MKKRIFIDMDGVLADFGKNIEKSVVAHWEEFRNKPDEIPGIFGNLDPIEGAVDAVKKLHDSGKFELFIATTAPWNNASALADKKHWIERYLGDIFHKKIVFTHRKDLLLGDYLIDDRLANGAENFTGTHLRFGWDYENECHNEYPTWDSILQLLLPDG